MPYHHIDAQDLSSIVKLQQDVVTADLDLVKLMELICQQTQTLTRATGAVVEMAEGEEMVYRAASGTLASSIGLRLKMNSSLSGLSVKSGEVLHCEDSETDPRVNKEACRKVGARSMICVPLIHHQAAVGVLKVVSSEPKIFTEREIYILRLTAGLLSASIAKSVETAEKNRALELLKDSEQKATAATQAKSEFLANMSHEIRTPLNGVLGVSSLLTDTTLSETQLEYVKLIRSSAETLLTLVNDILDFSKIEAKKLVLEKIDFELTTAVDDIRQILSHTAKFKKLDLRVTLAPNLPKVVTGDPTRIRQILLNLVSNAIKFTKQGSVTIDVSVDQGALLFQVIDTGIGIAGPAMEHMFQPFTQVDASTTRKYGGTGLGLSICKQLVDLMHGEIGVSSVENEGSTFWFKVRLPTSDKVLQVQSSAQAITNQNLKILVAEDNSVNQMIVRVMLEKMGHKVVIAGNGKEALDALSVAPFDVILMDCQMPEMDGYEATRLIRSLNAHWSNIHIIAMTANAMAGDKELCLSAGMNDYISKPMKKEDLIKVLNSSLIRS